MKQRFTPMVISLCLLGMVTLPAMSLAASHSSHHTSAATSAPSTPHAAKKNTTQTQSLNYGNMAQIEGPTDLPTSGPLYLPVDLDVPGQSFVSSGPYIGIPLEFSGSNLIINSPSVNEDIALLNIRKNIAQRLVALGRPKDSSGSHILLSGIIEGQALYKNGNGTEHQSDIDLTTANLDAYILGPSTWTSGLLELAYENNIGTQTGAFSSNDAVLNSRVFVNKAFVVLGDFQKSPFYSSFGQLYVPFGVYSTTMVSSPLTKILARTQARALVLGYKQQAPNSLNVSAYAFQGASYVADAGRINNGGINVDYSFKMHRVNADVGGGFIGNIADSQGMQFTGNNNNTPPQFGGFGGPTETFTPVAGGPAFQGPTGNEQLEHRVPAYDFHALIGLGDNVQLLGEYILTATSFSAADLTIDGQAARPQAMHVEGVYNIPYFVQPTSVGVAYDMSKDALAIGLPAQRYSMTINRSFWKNTLQSLEFRRDLNYAADKTSSGSGVIGPNGNGDSNNMVTLQFDYYF